MIYFYVACFTLVMFDFLVATTNWKFWEKCGSISARVIILQFALLCLMLADIFELIK